jgi:hypothetical protein
MKTAIIFHGLTGVHGKYGQGKPVNLQRPFDSFKKNILNCNQNVDIFAHSWSTENKNEILQLYKPVSHKFETQKVFTNEYTVSGHKYKGPKRSSSGGNWQNALRFHSMYSKWYSAKQSIKLKQEYEKKHKFKYNMTMLARFDLGYNKEFIFKNLNPDKIYINANRAVEGDSGFADLYVLSSSQNLDTLFGDGGLFDYIEKNTNFVHAHQHNHYHLRKIIEVKNLTNKVERQFPERTGSNTDSLVYVDRDHENTGMFLDPNEDPLGLRKTLDTEYVK